MKTSLDEIEKRLPYRESQDYLDSLVDRAVDGAIKQHAAVKRRWRSGLMATSAAAVVLLLIGIGLKAFFYHDMATTRSAVAAASPLDDFLSSLDDTEASQLTYYEIEEIPEY